MQAENSMAGTIMNYFKMDKFKKLDLAIMGALDLALTSDAAMSVRLHGMSKQIVYETYSKTETIVEIAPMSKYLISQLGLAPGVIATSAIDIALYLGLSYCCYRAMKKVLEYDKWDEMPFVTDLIKELNKTPIVKRIPSYATLLAATYIHIMGFNSWYSWLMK